MALGQYDYEVCAEHLEISDPSPNIYELFVSFDHMFFGGRLSTGAVTVAWSENLRTAAGVCAFEPRSRFCTISLSRPLLALRPRKDLVETFLHEMIHAYLFITNNDRDRDGHGPNFKNLMGRINTLTNANITIYHSFHEEVHYYKSNWYRCSGPCRTETPLFGYRKGKKDRGPCNKDAWYIKHKKKCNGVFLKVSKGPTKKDLSGKMNSESKIVFTNGNLKVIKPTKSHVIPFSGKEPIIDKSKVIKSPKTNNTNNSEFSEIIDDMLNNSGINTKPVNIPQQIFPANDNNIKIEDNVAFIPFSGKGMTLGGPNISKKTHLSDKSTTESSNIIKERSRINNLQSKITSFISKGTATQMISNVTEAFTTKESHLPLIICNENKENMVDKNEEGLTEQSFNDTHNMIIYTTNDKVSAETAGVEMDVEMRDLSEAIKLSLESVENDPEMKDYRIAIEKSLQEDTVDCPACFRQVLRLEINDHLNWCLQ